MFIRLLSQEGGITIPKIDLYEPLKLQDQYFLDCIEKKISPELADAQKGLNVVKTLSSIQESMHKQGACVAV